MSVDTKNPLIIQSDRAILLEVDNPRYEAARDALGMHVQRGILPNRLLKHLFCFQNIRRLNMCFLR